MRPTILAIAQAINPVAVKKLFIVDPAAIQVPQVIPRPMTGPKNPVIEQPMTEAGG